MNEARVFGADGDAGIGEQASKWRGFVFRQMEEGVEADLAVGPGRGEMGLGEGDNEEGGRLVAPSGLEFEDVRVTILPAYNRAIYQLNEISGSRVNRTSPA